MKYKLTLVVVALMGFSTFLFLQFYFYRDINGLFINLAAVFLQILIAILLVDYLVERNERAQWKGFEEKLRRRIISLSNFTILEIRGVLGISLNPDTAAGIPDLNSLKVSEALHADTRDKDDDFAIYLQNFSSEQWRSLIKGMRLISSEAERTLLQYFPKLRPRQLELLSEIQEHADLVVLFPEVFPIITKSLKRDTEANDPHSSLVREQLVQRVSCRMKELVRLSDELVKTVS